MMRLAAAIPASLPKSFERTGVRCGKHAGGDGIRRIWNRGVKCGGESLGCVGQQIRRLRPPRDDKKVKLKYILVMTTR